MKPRTYGAAAVSRENHVPGFELAANAWWEIVRILIIQLGRFGTRYRRRRSTTLAIPNSDGTLQAERLDEAERRHMMHMLMNAP